MKSALLSLVVPGLIDPVPYLNELPKQELPELPVLAKFLSHGQYSQTMSFATKPLVNSPVNLYHCLLKQLSLNHQYRHPPIASASYLFDQLNSSEKTVHTTDLSYLAGKLDNKWLMRIDPCYMVADRDQLVLAKTGKLNLSLTEARQLADEIMNFYSAYDDDQFWTIEVINAERWYLISEKPINIDTVPPEKVIGQSIKSYLFSAASNENRYWLNLFNEFQMILHQSQVNKQRREEHKIPINSVWFWAAEKYTHNIKISADIAQLNNNTIVYTNNHSLQGLALISGSQYSAITDHYIATEQESLKHSIYVLDEFAIALKNKDVFNWVGILAQFEENYLQQILHDIHSGRLGQVEIISPTGRQLLITKKLLRRWWRKKKKFYHFYAI